jgi:hypothetical protein
LDGSEPTAGSCYYLTGHPIHIIEDITIKAIAMKDGLTNSPVMSESYTVLSTGDMTPPSYVLGYPTIGLPQPTNSKKVGIDMNVNEDGTAYYVVVHNDAPTPDIEQILEGLDATGSPALDASTLVLTANVPRTIVTNALPLDSTAYDVYVVVQDTAENTTTPSKFDVTTPAFEFAVTDLQHQGSGIMRVTFNLDVDVETGTEPMYYEFLEFVEPPAFPGPSEYPVTATVSGNTVDLDISTWYNSLSSGTIIKLHVTSIKDESTEFTIALGHSNIEFTKP